MVEQDNSANAGVSQTDRIRSHEGRQVFYEAPSLPHL